MNEPTSSNIVHDVKYHLSCLDTQFPRIKNNIELMWGTAQGRKYMVGLIIDDRDRPASKVAGFPAATMTTITALLDMHDDFYPKLKPVGGIWDQAL